MGCCFSKDDTTTNRVLDLCQSNKDLAVLLSGERPQSYENAVDGIVELLTIDTNNNDTYIQRLEKQQFNKQEKETLLRIVAHLDGFASMKEKHKVEEIEKQFEKLKTVAGKAFDGMADVIHKEAERRGLVTKLPIEMPVIPPFTDALFFGKHNVSYKK